MWCDLCYDGAPLVVLCINVSLKVIARSLSDHPFHCPLVVVAMIETLTVSSR